MAERIAVVGAGAVGGHVGGHMARAGHDVTLFDPWPAHVAAIRDAGLRLTGLTEPENVTVPVAAHDLCDLQRFTGANAFDVAMISLKSYDTRWAAEMVVDYLKPGGFVVALQNGINEPAVADVLGWGRTVGAIASKISVELHAPGQIRRLVKLGGAEHTVFRLGEVHGRITPRLERLVEMFRVVDSAAATTNLWGERWTKLCVNCMRNPIAAATGRGGNANDRDDGTRRLSIRLGGEAAQVGRALGYRLETLYGVLADDMIAAGAGDADAMARAEAIILEQTRGRSDDGRPSMGQDIFKGRRTEIDFLNGYVARCAGEAGLAAPLNAAIAAVVRDVERGLKPPAPDNLAALV